jgi:hypothetical protein
MSDKNLEQRINIKFCVKIGKRASETFKPISQLSLRHFLY